MSYLSFPAVRASLMSLSSFVWATALTVFLRVAGDARLGRRLIRLLGVMALAGLLPQAHGQVNDGINFTSVAPPASSGTVPAGAQLALTISGTVQALSAQNEVSMVTLLEGATSLGSVSFSADPVSGGYSNRSRSFTIPFNLPIGDHQVYMRANTFGGPSGYSLPYNISVRQTLTDGATFVSQSAPPAQVNAGDSFWMAISFRNSGTSTWSAQGANPFRLGSVGESAAWGTTRVSLGSDTVAPGAQYTFYFYPIAPAQAGTYNFSWQMLKEGASWFGGASTAASIKVVKVIPPPSAAISVPSSYAVASNVAGGVVAVPVNGTGIPGAGASIAKLEVLDNGGPIYSVTNTSSLSTIVYLPTGGNHALQIRATDNTGTNAAATSAAFSVSAQIDAASFVLQNPPLTIAPGATADVTVMMRNTGTSTWSTGNQFFLGAQNPIDNHVWNSANRVTLLSAVAPNQVGSFLFRITAPTTLGTYNFNWQMVHELVSWFGEATPSGITIRVAAEPPMVTMTSPAGGDVYNVSGATASVYVAGYASSASGAGISKLEVLDNGVVVPAATSSGSSLSAYVSLRPGPHSLQLRATDTAGAPPGLSAAAAITVMNYSPVVQIVTPLDGGMYAVAGASGAVPVKATVAGSNGASITRIDVVEGGTLRATGNGATLNSTATLAPGAHTLTFVATDSTGATGSSTVGITVAAAQPPTASLLTPTAGSNTYTAGTIAPIAVSATSSASGGATVTLLELLDGGSVIASSGTGIINGTVPLTGIGAHSLQLRVTDSVGQQVTTTARTVTVAAATAGNSAKFVSQSVPSQMRMGQPYSVTVTMQNNGTTTWTPGANYRLGAQNPQDYNHVWTPTGRAYLSGPVATGELAVFTIPVTAPTPSKVYNIQWKMLQEFIGWFGDPSINLQIPVTVGAGPVATLSATSTNVRVAATAAATVSFAGYGASSTGVIAKLELLQGSDSTGFAALPVQSITGSDAALSWNTAVSLPAGVYFFKLRSTDDAGVATDSALVMVNVVNSSLLGTTTGVRTNAVGKPELVGWTCQKNANAGLAYQVLMDAPSLSSGATLLTSGVANVATEPDNAVVQSQCATPGSGHHFVVDLSAYTPQYAGHQLYVRATDAAGANGATLPCVDNGCTVPGSLRVGMTTPIHGDTFLLPGPAFLRMLASGYTGTLDEAGFYINNTWYPATAESDAPGGYWISVPLDASSTPYTVYAKIRQGNTTLMSAQYQFNVAAAVTATLSITNPAGGKTVVAGTVVPLSASASGTVQSVRFFAGTTPIGVGVNSNNIWSINWTTSTAGSFDVVARAYDPAGISIGVSAPVTVTVTEASQSGSSPIAVAIAPPYLSNADAGTLPGELTVTPAGAAAYGIPIVVPPGTAGVQPALSLDYSSDAPNGFLGLGWQLGGLSSIHRCGKTIAQDGVNDRIRFASSDRLCLDGQRLVLANLPLSDANYWADGAQYRTEIDSFSRITAVGVTTPDNIANRSFKVESRDGRVMSFGGNADSAVKALLIGTINSGVTADQPSAKNGAQSWAVDRITDRAGNYISFSYRQDADSGEHRPDVIRYGGSGLAAHAAVQFSYESRADAWKRYIDESRNDVRTRVAHIKTYVGSGGTGDVISTGTMVRDYVLEYAPSATSGRSLLSAVQVRARNPQTGEMEPLPKTTFAWGQPDPAKHAGFENKGFWPGAPILTVWANTGIVQFPVNGANRSDYFAFSDFENHGRSDVLEKRVGRPSSSSRDDFSPIQPGAVRTQYRYFHNNGGGFTAYSYKLNTEEAFVVLEAADFDGDGAPDLLVSTAAGPKVCLSPLGKPNGLGDAGTPLIFTCDPSRGAVGANVGSLSPYVVDVMGDGRAAIYSQMDDAGGATVCIQSTCMQDTNPPKNVLFGKPGVEPYVYVNTARFVSATDYVDFAGIGKHYDVRWTAPSYISFNDSEGPNRGGRWVNLQPRILMTGFHAPSDTSGAGEIAAYAYETATSLSGGSLTPYVFDDAAQGGGLSGDFSGFGNAGLAYGFYNYDSAAPSVVFKRAEMTLCLATGRALDCAIRKKYSGANYLAIRSVADFVGDGQPKMLVQNAPFFTNNGSAEGGLNVCRVTGDDTTKGAGTDDGNIQCDPWSGLKFSFASSSNGKSEDQIYQMDLLGTGRPQLVYYHSGTEAGSAWREDGRWEVFAPIDVAVAGQALDRIHQVTNGVGAVSTVEYADGLADGVVTRTADLRMAYPLRATSGVGKVVKRLRKANGGKPDLAVRYQYKDGATDLSGRGAPGYAQVVAVEERPGSTEVLRTTTTTYRQDWPFAGTVLSSSVVAGQGKTLSRSVNSPDLVQVTQTNGAITVCPVIKRNVTVRKDLDGSDLGATSTDNQYTDGWCNVTQQDVGVAEDSPTAVAAFKTTTTTNFRNDASNWLIGLPLTTTVTKTDPLSTPASVTRVTRNDYETTRGLLITQTAQPDDAVYQVVTSYDRGVAGNAFGLVNRQSRRWLDPATGAMMTPVDRSVVYDGFGRYPKTVTNALNQSEQYTYDAATGVRTKTADRNGLETSRTLDGFGRVLVETLPDKNEVRYYSKVCGSDCPSDAAVVNIVDRFHGQQRIAVPQLSYVSNVGNTVRTMTWGFDGQAIVADTRYDDYGRQYEVDHPHFDGTPGVVARRSLYDDLHRLEQLVTFDLGHNSATATNKYEGFVRTLKNAKGQSRVETRDLLGQVRKVVQVMTQPGVSDTVTLFAYDPFGNLNKTTDPNKNVILVKYDTFGRKVELNDPDLGVIKYSVDPVGQVWRQVSPRQAVLRQSTTFKYDALGRMNARYETDLESHWVFDQQGTAACAATKSCGQLVEAYTQAGTLKDYDRLHTYDDAGRPQKVVQTIGDGASDASYSASTDFDAWGRPIRQTYQRNSDASKIFDSRYNENGYLARLERAGVTLWKVVAQDASQRPTEVLLGNGLTYKSTFNDDTDRLDAGTLAVGASAAALNESYLYDLLGNVTTRTQLWNQGGYTEVFGYDELNRLTSGESGGVRQTFDYDGAGNLTRKTGVGAVAGGSTYGYPAQGANAVRPHAISKLDGDSFTYDDNGNLLSGGGRSYTWTSFDMPITITRGTATSGFVYGPEHQRLRQSRGGGAEVYAGAQEVEKNDGQLTIRTYWPYGVGFEVERGGETKLYWTHVDRLGSPMAVSDQSGVVQDKLAYDAWGKRRTSDGASAGPYIDNKGFTGHEMLDSLELVHMNGRVYDPYTARFLSADPLVQDPINGQSYNRYSYVLNNPTNLTDPSGFLSQVEINGRVELDQLLRSIENARTVVAQAQRLDVQSRTNAKKPIGKIGFLTSKVLVGLSLFIVQENGAQTACSSGDLCAVDPVTGELNHEASAQKHLDYLLAQLGSDQGKDASAALNNEAEATAKTPPNPNGKKGGDAHQKEVEKAKKELEEKYKNDPRVEIIAEVRVLTPNGEKKSRFLDISAIDKNTGEVIEAVQVGRQNKSGTPVARERRAIEDVKKVEPSMDINFKPYNR